MDFYRINNYLKILIQRMNTHFNIMMMDLSIMQYYNYKSFYDNHYINLINTEHLIKLINIIIMFYH